jgi:hypothetical protein
VSIKQPKPARTLKGNPLYELILFKWRVLKKCQSGLPEKLI